MSRQNFHYNSAQMSSSQAAAMMENEAAALAAEMFDHFCSAMTMRQILGLYRNMCDTIGLRPGPLNEFYPKLKAKIKNWKAQALWKKFDARLSHRVYNKATACAGTRVLIIGAGPCGLRTAIEAQLLGAKVVVVEKRDRISRNNVLHLWPFLIYDLRALGAKKFYGKFCAGSIDHISIRQLQCILMKVALLLGVEIHEGVGFERLIEPTDGCGWRALVDPPHHAVSHFEFDALIGADGKRNTLEGFRRKEFRGKLAIAITANFINKRTEEEARVQEISGVAFIFNQSFFKELYHQTGIDLENIVYYKDETHYFVMTAKKHSLLDKGVIIQDCSDPAELLHPNNVNTQKLQDYAREAADFSTKYQMPNLEFAVNHYGKPDVAMFDFTSMFAAENSSRIVVRKNYRLLSCLVGDSLLEPFWPSGSGCARGFLSGMDAAYAIKLLSNPNNSLLAVLAQRESIYRLLAQTTPENLSRDHGGYTLDPVTRYPNLNRQSVIPHQVRHLLDTDDPSLLDQTFMDTNAIQTLPELPQKTRKRRTADATPMAHVLLGWIKSHLKDQDFVTSITEPSQCFTHGKVLCALIHRYRPDLVDWASIQECSAEESNETAFRIFEKDFNIPRIMSADESMTLENIDIKNWLHYLEQICEVFRGEIPHVKHPKLDYAEFKQKNQTANTMADFARLHRIAAAKREAAKDENGASHVSSGGRRLQKLGIADNHAASPSPQNVEHRRGRKRRSFEKYANIEERMARLADIDANRIDRQQRRRQQRRLQTENFLKSLHMLQANNYLRESDESAAFEDYSIFMYRQNAPEFTDRVKELEKKLLYPDRERGITSAMPRSGGAIDDQFSDRIRNIEEKFTTKNAAVTNKKPKDLLRAIGKIETTDWNVKEIEKKMEQSKKIHDIGKSREKVPKWSREQFVARQNKMSKPERQDSSEQKYKEIDNTLKALDKQLKEGSVLDRGERGKNKVASIAGNFGKKKGEENAQAAQKAGQILTSQGISEVCHFCKQRVYLMEKISAEGLTLHRSCLKCHHCNTSLRLGGYAFDRESPDGKFYCTQHYKLPPKDSKFVPKRLMHKQRQQEYAAFKAQRQESANTKKVDNADLLDNRGKTPERIEFENADGVSDGEPVEDQIMDENEWTDVNFRTGSEDEDEDEDSSSDESDSDSDSEMFEDPVGVDAQTLQLASEWIDKRSTLQDSEDEFYGYSSEDDDADSQTEGEELAKAREMRMNEVKLQPPLYVLTDTETEGVKKGMTQNNEIDNLKSQSSLLNTKAPLNLNSPDLPNSKDELLKSDMMKKLSLKEKWLNDQQSKPVPMEVDPPKIPKKNDEKKSFLTGILSSVKHLIKSDKEKSPKNKSFSPENVNLDKIIADETIDVDNFDELVVQSDKPEPGCVNKRIQAFLQKQKSDEVREEADEILNDIKEGNERLAKQMRDMEQRRFSENMKAIKSSVVDSKVASMKEVNLSKYFPNQQEKKPPAVAKNRDVKALKDVNLSKYFPQSSPTPGKKISNSPTGQSATSSAAASPLMPRKNISEIDLTNYFPGTPVLSRKASTSTPPSSPMTEGLPSFERRFSIVNSIPPPPPPPVPKKNILALQTVKKRLPANENIDLNVQGNKKDSQVPKKDPSPNKTQLKKQNPIGDFNMFDQLLDGAIDLKQIEEKSEVDLDNFESLIDETKLERSPSKEYAKIFDDGSGKSKSESKEISLASISRKRSSVEREMEEAPKVIKKTKKKTPEKNEILDKFSIDPKIIKNLNKEYQRLLGELERSSKSPETENPEIQQEAKNISDDDGLVEIIEPKSELVPLQPKVDNKRKSPQRSEDRKKFKEELEIENPTQMSQNSVVVNEDSVIARLEKKYRRGSVKTAEEEKEPETQTCSVIERLERRLKQKRELENSATSFNGPCEIIKDSGELNSIALVKVQCRKQENALKKSIGNESFEKADLKDKENFKTVSNGESNKVTSSTEKDVKVPVDSNKAVKNSVKNETITSDSIKKGTSDYLNQEQSKSTQAKTKSPLNEPKIKSPFIETSSSSVSTIKKLKDSQDTAKEQEQPQTVKKNDGRIEANKNPQSSSVKKPETNCFDKFLSLPKDNIDDIFSEFSIIDGNAEENLEKIQETFDKIVQDEPEPPKKGEVKDKLETPKKDEVKFIRRKNSPKKPAKIETERDHPISSFMSLPKENDFDFHFEPKKDGITSDVVESKTIDKRNDSSDEEIKSRKPKCKSLRMDLDEIDFGISERPLNLDNAFPHQSSVEDIPDSPKSLNSNDESKVVSARDSAYSGSRRSSAGEKEVQENEEREKKPKISASYINVLKEISSGLIGVEDEPLILLESLVKPEPSNARISTEQPTPKETVKQSYTNVLQDISNSLIGSDLYEEKNYSQIIPPSVQGPPSSFDNLKISKDNGIHDVSPEIDEILDIKIPVAPARRHKSVESNGPQELSLPTKRFLPASKSFEHDTISGRTSKNSTEYYDCHYPTTRKYDTSNPNHQEIRAKSRQRALDDLMVKTSKSRIYDSDDILPRRAERRESSEPYESKALLERGAMLRRRKEDFMRDQMNDTSNPYIREMMRQDFDHPIDISDIKKIRQHPSSPLQSTAHISSYQRPFTTYTPSTRTSGTYGKSSVLSHTPIVSSSYSRPSAITSVPSYKSSVPKTSYLSPSSSTASKILTKSHTMSPPNKSYSTTRSAYPTRPITSLSDTHSSATSSRLFSSFRPSYSQNKTSGSSRDACVIS